MSPAGSKSDIMNTLSLKRSYFDLVDPEGGAIWMATFTTMIGFSGLFLADHVGLTTAVAAGEDGGGAARERYLFTWSSS